jgi:hypothetical protein
MATVDARAARERKQKMFVVVGGVVLLALLAFQLPRILGGSSPTAQPAAETTTAGDPAATSTVAPTSAPTQVALRDTDRRPAAAPDKLRSFSLFSPKNPFVQQVAAPSPTAGSTGTAGSPPAPGKEETPKAPVPSEGFTVGGTPAAAVTVISVNGNRQALVPGAAFPSADPVFVLVAEQVEAKTVVIGVAGGAYESGAKTTKLRVGKPLVLVNTTTGARYRLVLVAVGTGSTSSAAAPGKSPTPTP